MIAACGQMQALTIDQAAEVWPAVDRLAAAAANAHADLLVFPETTYPAYWLESAERYLRGDILRSAEVLTRFAAAARRHQFYLVAGFVEESDGRLFNSAAMFDRAGELVGIARKSFLWDCDNRWFAPGRRIAAMDTEFGRIGVMICADCRAPEIAATLVADGARMIVVPTAWVNASHVGPPRNVHPEFLIRARAIEFGVPFVCCSKSGVEGDKLGYVGQSRIVDADGTLLAEAPVEGERLIVAAVEPSEGRPLMIEPSLQARLLSHQPPYRADRPGARVRLPMDETAEGVTRIISHAGARVNHLTAREIACFAPARLAALEGAQVLVVQGAVDEECLARARAAENRVFVIAADRHIHLIVHPDGSVLYRGGHSGQDTALDLALADVKQFTPETDLWEQRRVSDYRLAMEAAACGKA